MLSIFAEDWQQLYMSFITVNSFLPISFSFRFADDLAILSESQAGLQDSLNKLEKYCTNGN
jgi:hypothetical protein